MRLFSKKKESKESLTSDAVAQRIAGNIIGGQQRIADYLNVKTQHLPGRFWLYTLILFCVAFGSYCLYLLISACN